MTVYELPHLLGLQRIEEVRGFGLLVAARLERVGSTGPFEVGEGLRSVIRSGLGVHYDSDHPDVRALKSYASEFYGDDVSIRRYYQAAAVQAALFSLSVNREGLEAQAKRLMFISMNAWQSLDDLRSRTAPAVNLPDSGRSDALLLGELSSQRDDVAQMVSAVNSEDVYFRQLGLVYAERGEFASVVNSIPSSVGWGN